MNELDSTPLDDSLARLRHRHDLITGHAAVDAEICRRCNATARYSDAVGDPSCPNCGLLHWVVEPTDPSAKYITGGGYWPVAPREETGYFIDNPHPAAGLREPARLWVEGHHGNKH